MLKVVLLFSTGYLHSFMWKKPSVKPSDDHVLKQRHLQKTSINLQVQATILTSYSFSAFIEKNTIERDTVRTEIMELLIYVKNAFTH